jgi:acetyl-CoA acetyltransferase
VAELREVAIAGLATTAQTRQIGRFGVSYALEALRLALDDAGMERSDIEGLYSYIDEWPQIEGSPSNSRTTNWATQLGIPIRWSTGAANSGAGTGVAAILDAAAAIGAGYIDTAAIVLGLSSATPRDPKTASWTTWELQFAEWTGTYTAAQFALTARRHMHKYGTTVEQLARAAATIRNYGHINPGAVMHGRGPYSVEDILAAPMAADPLSVLMCSQVNNGGAAMIITTAERARDLQKPVIRVLGGADQHSYAPYVDPPVLERQDGTAFSTRWARDGMAMAGVVHDDFDVVELYDGFANWILMQWEWLGFCGPGEGGPFVETGIMGIDGKWPTCTDGGCLSYSHMGAPALLRPLEAVRQLRGEVADGCPGWQSGVHTHQPGQCRQAPDAEVALAVSMGPPTGGGQLVVLAKE